MSAAAKGTQTPGQGVTNRSRDHRGELSGDRIARCDTSATPLLLHPGKACRCRFITKGRRSPRNCNALLIMLNMSVRKRVALNDSVMTVNEVAEYLKIHRTTVYQLVKQGQLQGFRIGVDWRFRRKDVDRWMTSRIKTDSTSS